MWKGFRKEGHEKQRVIDSWLEEQKAFPSETKGLVKAEKHKVIKKSLGPIL